MESCVFVAQIFSEKGCTWYYGSTLFRNKNTNCCFMRTCTRYCISFVLTYTPYLVCNMIFHVLSYSCSNDTTRVQVRAIFSICKISNYFYEKILIISEKNAADPRYLRRKFTFFSMMTCTFDALT
jgi:hypothetical protein